LIRSLRAEIEQMNFNHTLNMQLLEEKLRKQLTDAFQANLELNLKQCEQRCENKLLMQTREFEAKVKLSTQNKNKLIITILIKINRWLQLNASTRNKLRI